MAKIVVLTSRFPFPLEKGDKLRIYNQIKGLSENNEVHLIALDENKISKKQSKALIPFCKTIHVFRISKLKQATSIFRCLFTKIPLQVGMFYDQKIHNQINSLLVQLSPDAVYCHLIRMSEYVRKENSINKTIDYMDAFSIGMKRRAGISNLFLKPIFEMEYNRLLKYEREVFNDFENKIIISTQDRDAIAHAEKDKIQIVPNGVDFTVFHAIEKEKKYDLLFTGNKLELLVYGRAVSRAWLCSRSRCGPGSSAACRRSA